MSASASYIALNKVEEHIIRHRRWSTWNIDSPMIAVEMFTRVEGPARCSYNGGASGQPLREYFGGLFEYGMCSTMRLPS